MKTITLTFTREALMYDIANYAYIEAHRAGTPEAHIISDICAEGNADRVSRLLHTAYCEARMALRAVSPRTVPTAVNDDSLIDPDSYVIEIVPERRFTEAHTSMLTAAIHEYMVASAMAHWLKMLRYPDQYWVETASAALSRITCFATLAGPRTRRMHPW